MRFAGVGGVGKRLRKWRPHAAEGWGWVVLVRVKGLSIFSMFRLIIVFIEAEEIYSYLAI